MNSGPKSGSNQDVAGKSQRNARFAGAVSREEQAALMVVWGLIVAGCCWAFISANGVRSLIDIDQAPKTVVAWQVDLNLANRAQLMAIPGIGKKTSAAIIEDRDNNGPFLSIDDLCRVHGIGQPTLDRVRPFLLVDVGRNSARTVQHRVNDGKQF